MKETQFTLYPGVVWCSDPLPGLREVTHTHTHLDTHTRTVRTQMRALSVEDVAVLAAFSYGCSLLAKERSLLC